MPRPLLLLASLLVLATAPALAAPPPVLPPPRLPGAEATPMAVPKPRRPAPTGAPKRRPPITFEQAPAPIYDPLATPRPKATPRPRPTATPRPAWRPPRGAVYVDRSGIYPASVWLRYGQSLRFLQPSAQSKPLALIVVDPHDARTGAVKRERAFPQRMATSAKWTWLGTVDGYKHRHWAIANGPMLTVTPESFLAIHDEIWGAGVGYLWPVRFLFYVAIDGTWHKLIVTMGR